MKRRDRCVSMCVKEVKWKTRLMTQERSGHDSFHHTMEKQSAIATKRAHGAHETGRALGCSIAPQSILENTTIASQANKSSLVG
jgi:hypothetical protein